MSWDGTTVRELLPTQAFHQGLLETKDIDGDGFDEVLIWEGVWREGTVHWEPQPFNVHIFHAAQNGYELQSTLHTDRLYYPARVIRVSIGIMGLPQAMELRRSSPGAAREQIASGIRAGEVTFEFVARFIAEAVQLNNENFPADALSALDAAADALPHVSDMSDRQLLEYGVWRSRAFSHYLLGQFSEGSHAYAQAVRAAPDSERLPRVEVAGLHRERGMLAWALGSAEEGLVHLGRAHAILLGLDQQLPEVKGELSRLLSNLGLVYASLGAWSEAEHVFGDAAVLDRELERADGQSINFLGLGIVRSANGDVAAALDAFSSGSLVLDPVSDRDREADINLEWGQTLVEAGRITDGLEHLKRALFLTSVENLLGQGGRHYFALGEAHLAAANLGLARAYLTRALEVARDVGYVETEWRSLFALARLDQLAAEPEHVEANLREAIGVLERMRPHHLPDLLRISFLHTSRVAPYEHLTRLLCDQGRIAEAFAVVERAKTRVLVEQLAMMEISPPMEVDSELVQQERQLLEELRRNDVMQRDAFLLRPGRPMDLSQSVARAAAALESLWGQMREQGGRAAQYVALRRGEPLSAAQMREILSQ